jgi:primosomal replication protein N
VRNQIVLSARVLEFSGLRFTPGGLPVVTLQLDHASDQFEADKSLKVALRLKAMAVGEVAEKLAQALEKLSPNEAMVDVNGFLAGSLNPNKLVTPTLHITAFRMHTNEHATEHTASKRNSN